jgi:hypothetical protein
LPASAALLKSWTHPDAEQIKIIGSTPIGPSKLIFLLMDSAAPIFGYSKRLIQATDVAEY